MHDQRKRVAHFPVQENVQFDEFGTLVPDEFIVETRIALRSRFQFVEEVVYDFIERQAVFEPHALGVDIFHIAEHAAAVLTQFHDGADIVGRDEYFRFDHGFFHILDVRRRRQVRGILHKKYFPVRLMHFITHGRRGGDDFKIKFAFDALLNDLHVQKAQKPATEPEAEGDGIFRLEGQRRVVEFELADGVFEIVELTAVKREDAAEHDGLYFFISRQRRRRRTVGVGDGVPHRHVLDGLDRGGDIADLARFQNLLGLQFGRERAYFGDVVYRGR